jgi:uncharacterized membrane protein
MASQKLKVLIAAIAALVLILAAGVAYANSSQPTGTGASGANGAQLAGNDESDGPGTAEEPGDADEPGDVDGPGDVED